MQKECTICNNVFDAIRNHAKYCPDCKKKANNLRVKKHRNSKKNIYLTLEDLRNNPKYQKDYKKLVGSLDTNLSRKDLKKATGFDNDKLSFYIRQFRLNGIIEPGSLQKRNYYNLTSFLKFEPTRIWYKDYIDSINSQQMILGENSTVFLKGLSHDAVERSEYKNIRKSMNILQETYFLFCQPLWKIGLRLANDIWIDFIKDINASGETKLFFWLEILRVHFLATDRWVFISERNGLYRLGFIHPIVFDLYSSLKLYKFEHSHVPWSEKFTELFRKVITDLDQTELKRFKSKFNNVCIKSLDIRIKNEDFITVLHSETLIQAKHYEKLNKRDKKFLNKKSSKMIRLNKFDFFKGLEQEIKNLGFYDKQHFYNELQYLANSFDLPMVLKKQEKAKMKK